MRRRLSPVKIASLKEIEAKLQSAEKKRKERLQGIIRKAAKGTSQSSGNSQAYTSYTTSTTLYGSPSRDKRRGSATLDWKLECASEKRNSNVERVRSKASYFLSRRKHNLKSFEQVTSRRARELSEKIAERDSAAAAKRYQRQKAILMKSKSIDVEIRSIAERRLSAKRKLFKEHNEKISSAETTRASLIAARGKRAADHVAHVKQVAARHAQRRRELAATRIQRAWREWRRDAPLTSELANDVKRLGIKASLPVDEVMLMLQKKSVIQVTSRMVARISKLMAAGVCGKYESIGEPELMLLKKATSPGSYAKRKNQSSNLKSPTTAPVRQEKQSSTEQNADNVMVRYPPKILLCAYLIVGYPEVVLNGGTSPMEESLQKEAKMLLTSYEYLLQAFCDINGDTSSSPSSSCATSLPCQQKRSSLVSFQSAWEPFLARFVEWKSGDANALQSDLILMACRLEESVLSICGREVLLGKELTSLNPDHEVLRLQTIQDKKTLRNHVMKITGDKGALQFDEAIAKVHAKMIRMWDQREKEEQEAAEVEAAAAKAAAGALGAEADTVMKKEAAETNQIDDSSISTAAISDADRDSSTGLKKETRAKRIDDETQMKTVINTEESQQRTPSIPSSSSPHLLKARIMHEVLDNSL